MKKTYLKRVFLFILLIILIPINVYAKNEMNLSVSKTDLEIGDRIKVTAKFSGDQKLYAMTATLSYDNNVFEEIDDMDFVADDETTDILYNAQNHKFGILNKTGEINKDLFQVYLKVKKNANVGNTYITLTNISASDGTHKTIYPKESVKVLVTRDALTGEVVPVNRTEEPNDLIEEVLRTFSTKPIMLGIAVILSFCLAYSIYTIIKRKNKKIIFSFCGITAVLCVILTSLLFLENSKKDVNNDGQKDYEDAQEIMKYLLDIKGTKEEEPVVSEENITQTNTSSNSPNKNPSKQPSHNFDYDVNNDGKVDIEDVGGSVQDTTENIQYKVELRERNRENIYLPKGSFTLDFDAIVTNNETIKEIEIDGIFYPVVKNSTFYSITLETPTTAGVHNFKITKVKLANLREVNVNLTIQKEILKSVPYVDLFQVNEKDHTVTFHLEDPDKSFIEGTAVITDAQNETVISAEVTEENTISYEFKEDEIYNIFITATYDLDSNELNSLTQDQNRYEDEIIYNHPILITNNYQFQVSNVSITDAIEKQNIPVIRFDSINQKGFQIEYIVVNGKEYDVESIENENHYEIPLKDIDTSTFGKFYVNIDKIVLTNLATFENHQDYEIGILNYTVLKNSPTIENIHLEENQKEEKINVSYIFQDPDQTMEKLTAVLLDSTEKVVDQKDNLTPGNPIDLSYAGNKDGRYKVKFLVDCNLGTERHTYTNKNIGEQEILTQKEIFIQKAVVTTEFPTKNQPKYKIIYTVSVSDSFKENNIYNVVSGITINGLNYDADKTRNPFESSISFTVPSEAGVVDLEATRVQLQYEDYNNNRHEFFSVEPYTVQIDVLREKPSIENLKIIEENYEEKSATFQFDVVEDQGGFERGEIELDQQRQEIHLGQNQVTFKEIETDKNLTLNFYADYDLDTNTLKGKEKEENHYTNSLIYNVSYGLYQEEKFDNVTLSNLRVHSSNDNNYFAKQEFIQLEFQLANLDEDLQLFAKKIIINEEEYELFQTKEEYFAVMKGDNTAGLKEIKITDLILNNGKKVTLKEPITKTIEILKDPVSVYDFKSEVKEDEIHLQFVLSDPDHSINNLNKEVEIKITDEDGKIILDIPYQSEISFPKQDNVLRYYVKLYASYDRDSSLYEENYYSNHLILDEVISIDKNNIELKEITDITLYKEENNKMLVVDQVDIHDLQTNLPSYFVKTSMNHMPTTYSKIKKVLIEENHLILILDYNYVTQENESEEIRLDFGEIKNNMVTNEVRPETFEQLIERIKLNPEGTFELTHDLDASNVNENANVYLDLEFKGTLKGNGHTISKLTKPLFQTIQGGTIENLKLEDIQLSSLNARGSLANKAINAHISQVFINAFRKVESDGVSGTLIGEATQNTVIDQCRTTNFVLNTAWLSQQVGGLVGVLDNSTIKNSYVDGSMTSTWNYVGGLVGNVKKTSLLENNIVKVSMNSDYLSCGFACADSNLAIAKNNINLSSGKFGNYFMNRLKTSENNYQLVKEKEEFSGTGITNILTQDVNENLFQNAHFDSTIWNFANTTYANIPTLQAEKVYALDPNKVKDLYDENKEILYHNLSLLMPFYDDTKIAKTGSLISENHLLNQEEIMHIFPIDETGNVVSYLTSENPRRIKKIKLVFKNKTKKEYEVRYDNTYDMVASYRILDLKIDYTYNHYIIDSNSQLVNNLTNYLQNLTYEDNLDPLTPSVDSRIYREFYYDVTKKELKDFVLKYLSNSNYTNTTSDEVVNDYLEKEIKKDKKLEKVLYVYNYFRRFYSVSIDGIMLHDLMLFSSQGFHPAMNPDEIALAYLSNEQNFKLDKTSDAYTNTLSKYTNLKTIPKLLEYFVTTLSDLDPATWYANEFKGYLVEINVDDRPDILYTLWDHIQYEDQNNRAVWFNYALPILTIPENAAYIISTPTQFLIGAQRVYIANPENPEEQAKFRAQAAIYTARMKDYYETAAKIIEEEKYFNQIHTIQIDKRFTYDQNGNTVFQSPYQTQEPFHKNFNELFGTWAHQDGNAATANGTVIYWRAEGALEGEWTYHTWSHETAHNIDARLFLKDNERRFDAGGEDYADSNLMQAFGDGDIVMNFSRHFNEDDLISSNLDPSRINSPEKVYDFYNKLFQTVYIMDYIEGKAFLKLNAEEQSKIAVQVFYPNESKYPEEENKHLRYKYTVYHQIEQEDFEQMTLKTIDDLYENKLVIYPGVIYSTLTDNRYGGENIYKVHWYQPNNIYGRPDSYSIKWFAYEMLGYKGYDDGYIEYFSNIHSINTETYQKYKTDIMALQTITKDQNMDFQKYKHMRFEEVKNNLKYIQYIDVDQVYEDFLTALKEDAAYIKKVEEEAKIKFPGIDKTSEDARNKLVSEAKKMKNSTEIRRQVFYQIKRSTNDFRKEVYDQKIVHDVNLD